MKWIKNRIFLLLITELRSYSLHACVMMCISWPLVEVLQCWDAQHRGRKKKHAKGARLSWESKGTDSSNNTKYKLCKTVGVCYSLMRVIQASLLLSVKIQSSHKLFFHNAKHWLIINRTFFHTFKDISYFLFLNIKKQLPNKRASSHQLGPWDL